MDRIFTPWRYAYIADMAGGDAAGTEGGECLFCAKAASPDDQANLVVHRGDHCFIILNAYPYTNGHVMVVPYAHVDEFRKLPVAAAHELTGLCQRMETVLRTVYRPEGINLGMNIGKAAGAGVAGHIHMHVLPRWTADANFMSVVGETRVLPETLETTYERLRAGLTG